MGPTRAPQRDAAGPAARALHLVDAEVRVPWYLPLPSTPASFRALRTDEEAATEWSDERRLDLILSVVIGELSVRQAAALSGLTQERLLEWKDELLFDGRGPDDDDDDGFDGSFVLVT